MKAAVNRKPVLVAAGMDFEARVAQGPGVTVVYGQNRRKYREDLHRHVREGVRGLISFGVAGGLSPSLRPGEIIVATAVITRSGAFPTCPEWSKSLLKSIPHALHLPVFGSEAAVMTAVEKAALWSTAGAAAVDMESGPVAEVAAEYGLPYTVLRAVLDPAHRAIPQSALAGARDDGKTDGLAVLRSLMRRPHDFPGLIRLAGDSRKANRALFRSRQALGPLFGFGLLETGELALDME
ncbi:MAG: phosphorylase [Rhodomicrobium sp.]